MSLRTRIMDDLKAAMKAGQSEKVAQLRGITAKIKDLDVAARVKQAEVTEEEILAALRSMIKSRTESVALYLKGGRPELAEKEEGEINAIRHYLPPELDENAVSAEIEKIVTELGASTMKDMGRVMAVLKERLGAALDPAKASALVKKRLG